MSTQLLLNRKKLFEKKKNILDKDQTYQKAKEEFLVYLKRLIDLEKEIISSKSKWLLSKEEQADLLLHLEDKKLFLELTENYQTFD